MDKLLVLFCATAIILIIKNSKDEAFKKLDSILLKFTFEAETLFGSEVGKLKKSYVINAILNSTFYNELPLIIKSFITKDILSVHIDNFISNVFNVLKQENKNFSKLIKE